jgi:hypothetical protein
MVYSWRKHHPNSGSIRAGTARHQITRLLLIVTHAPDGDDGGWCRIRQWLVLRAYGGPLA